MSKYKLTNKQIDTIIKSELSRYNQLAVDQDKILYINNI